MSSVFEKPHSFSHHSRHIDESLPFVDQSYPVYRISFKAATTPPCGLLNASFVLRVISQGSEVHETTASVPRISISSLGFSKLLQAPLAFWLEPGAFSRASCLPQDPFSSVVRQPSWDLQPFLLHSRREDASRKACSCWPASTLDVWPALFQLRKNLRLRISAWRDVGWNAERASRRNAVGNECSGSAAS